MVFFVGPFGGKPSPGSRVAPCTPVRLLTGYARTEEEVALFKEELAACAPAKHLEWEDALDSFPDGTIPSKAFELNGLQWQLHARAVADDRRAVHLATPIVTIGRAGSLPALPSPLPAAAPANGQAATVIVAAPPQPRGFGAVDGSPTGSGSAAASDDGLTGGYGNGALAPVATSSAVDRSPEFSAGALAAAGGAAAANGYDSSGGSSPAGPAARRKYVRDIVVATNPAQDSLGRYKAIIALIEHCKSRARTLRPTAATDWGREPANSLLHTIVDVGEALAGFGNAHFPERSGEARAVLAADYKALLSEYLTHLGGVLVPGTCRGLAPDAEAELRSVGSLLATRCEAYKVLYEQLVSRVGGDASSRGGASDAPVLIFNTNANTVDASPVTHNTNTADAASKAKAIQSGLGAAAVAAAALALGLIARALARRGRGGGGGADGPGGQSLQRGGGRSLPRGRNGREMSLVSVLAACGDELRKSQKNTSLLEEDWRLGRIRLSWPPAPEPPGYQSVQPGACDIVSTLSDLYGR